MHTLLHPHHQAVLFRVLHDLSEKDQIIFCTHSPYFIDMSRYGSLAIVSKPNQTRGTEIFQCNKEIFSPDQKNYFRMLNEFDPERNEMFFSDKVMLVEGPSEKIGFPMVCKKMNLDLYSSGVSIIECGGKLNIPFFIQVLNAFGIHYVVVHDIDPITEADKKDAKSLAHAQEIFKFNETIKNTIDSSLGVTIPIDPEFDVILTVSKSQEEKLGKPFAVFRRINEISEKDIDNQIKRIVKSACCK